MSRPPRRIVTGHDAAGESIVLSDGPTPRTVERPRPNGVTAFHEIWVTDQTPALISPSEPEPTDGPVPVSVANGVLVRIIESPPGAKTEMARTKTVDVVTILEGEYWMLLDDGSETRLSVGDSVVQRGTAHQWENRSDRPTRVLAVVIGGAPTDELREVAEELDVSDGVIG